MLKKRFEKFSLRAVSCVGLAIMTLAACGGGGGGGSAGEDPSQTPGPIVNPGETPLPGNTPPLPGNTPPPSGSTPPLPGNTPPPSGNTPPPPGNTPPPSGNTPPPSGSTPPPASTPVSAIPTNIASGSTVSLECGKVYQGTLNVSGKSNITVTTAGTCGKASITTGQAITGWTKYKDNIYSAPISFAAEQLSLAGVPMEKAHWPNKPQKWVTASTSSTATRLDYTMPNADLAGATLVFQVYEYAIEERTITGYSGGSMTLAPHANGFNNTTSGRHFYVEGKLWMLDVAGEWAISNGRVYLWTPDGQSPEGRVWAAAKSDGIDARNSSNITIDGVKVFSTQYGIKADGAKSLKVLNTDIVNSSQSGIYAGGSTALKVDRSTITNSGRNGIDGFYGSSGAIITNSAIATSGTVGMPKMSDGGIFFGQSTGHTISNNTVKNSGYVGIQVTKNSNTVVENNVVDGACLELDDCGGIYTAAPDRTALNTRIVGNTVKNVKGQLGYGIYLDDSATGVTVTKNNISNSSWGLMVHNGFNNELSNNTFSASTFTHMRFGENSSDAITNNRVTNNTFVSTNGEKMYDLGSNSDVRNFGTFDYNTYITSNPNGFARTTTNLSYSQWKSFMGQDAHSTLRAP
jgi:parallel beta-helix repeat protein